MKKYSQFVLLIRIWSYYCYELWNEITPRFFYIWFVIVGSKNFHNSSRSVKSSATSAFITPHATPSCLSETSRVHFILVVIQKNYWILSSRTNVNYIWNFSILEQCENKQHMVYKPKNIQYAEKAYNMSKKHICQQKMKLKNYFQRVFVVFWFHWGAIKHFF